MHTTTSDFPRRIMIAGGSGLIGRHLSAALLARGDEVLVLSRDPAVAQARVPGCAVLHWHPGSDGKWQDELNVVDAVVDVSGAPFFTKWRGDYYKREVLGARRGAIQSLIEAIARAPVRPKAFISTSSLGPYGFRRDDQSLTEHSSPDIGPLSRDALELEARALQAEALGTRVALLRPGIVLAPDGGAFQLMTRAFARGLGAPVTPGTQWCSWIHIADAVELIISALSNERAQGPLNLTSPNPVRNHELAGAFAEATSRPLRPPIPGRSLHLMFGKAAITITHGQRVLPARALELGHQFRYPMLNHALDDLIRRGRRVSEQGHQASSRRPDAHVDQLRWSPR
ncbi:MAG: TIGR01777 family oxidoreductase [Solirubrobacteraceae bacterium]